MNIEIDLVFINTLTFPYIHTHIHGMTGIKVYKTKLFKKNSLLFLK